MPKGLKGKKSASNRRAFPVLLSLDDAKGISLHRQIYHELREAIFKGRLTPGMRLPGSRKWAVELGVGRNTVLNALEQLIAEGYIEGRSGSGTYVSARLPDLTPTKLKKINPSASAPAISIRGAKLAQASRQISSSMGGFFTPGLTYRDDFPFALWARLLGRHWRRPSAKYLGPSAPFGFLPLRQAIAEYLQATRAVVCRPEQVMIVSGVRQAINLMARLLLEDGDRVWIEDPGYLGLRTAFMAAGCKLIPVPVDEEGLVVAIGQRRAPKARMACVAPSHQFPLGVILSLNRRLDLLKWAQEANAWVMEDDWDSEFRYTGRPLASLQGLDRDGRVLYVGSFSKTMFASLRLGYLVVPEALIDIFMRARINSDDPPSLVPQLALADFLAQGYFAQHVRRLRRIYAERQEILLKAANRHLKGIIDLHPDPAGLHLVGHFTPKFAQRMSDRDAEVCAREVGLMAPALSQYYLGPPLHQGLVMGYAAGPTSGIEPAIKKLAQVLSR